MKRNIANELKKLDIEIGQKLFSITKENGILKPPSPLQARIIKYLIENEDKNIYQKDLEEEFKVSRATISGVLQAMESNKLVERITTKTDARLKKIILTNISKQRYLEMEKNFDILNKELEKGISEKEIEQFLSTLEKLRKNIKEF